MLWDRLGQIREVFSLFFCIGFSVISLVWNGNFAAKTVAKTQTVSNSISSSLDSVGGFFKSVYNKLESYEAIRKERDSYQKLIEEYKVLPQDILNLKSENELLKKELGFVPKTDYPTVKAEVLSVRLNSIYRTIIINKGRDHGIRPYMPVIAKALDLNGQPIQALVGKVIAVNSGSAIVQPIINSNFTMGVQIPKTNIWATLSGNSGRGMQAYLNYIDNAIIIDPKFINTKQLGPNLPSNENDSFEMFGNLGKVIYSSKGGGVFPADIPVGIIIEEGPRAGSFKTAYLKPFVKFEELQFVSIIKKVPDKWTEEWPDEKTISIENPFYGELNFPGEIIESKEKVAPAKKAPTPAKTEVSPPKKRPIDEDTDAMLKKLEEPN